MDNDTRFTQLEHAVSVLAVVVVVLLVGVVAALTAVMRLQN